MAGSYDWRRNASLTFLAVPLSLLALRTYQSMPRLDGPAPPAGRLPMLSIIVPARNEARNLVHLLPSLHNLRYPGPREVIVVDDGSTDDTAAIAEAHGACVVPLQGPPQGWKGKPHACHQGAQVARGEWFLFTDADTVHAPDSASLAMTYVLQQQVDGLSLFLKQQSKGVLDRLALTAAYAGLFANPHAGDQLLNGQYILLRRDVYENSGGFATVRGEILEDVALGDHLRRLGYVVPVLLGEDQAMVRMYDSLRQLWQGMSRLSAGSLRWTGIRFLWSATLVTALMSPLVTLFAIALGRLNPRWLPATWASAALPMIPWARRFGSPLWAALVPLGALLVQLAAVWGLISRRLGLGTRWKERKV